MSSFFSKKFQHICVSLDVNFNESLTSFEQLGPEKYCIAFKMTFLPLQTRLYASSIAMTTSFTSFARQDNVLLRILTPLHVLFLICLYISSHALSKVFEHRNFVARYRRETNHICESFAPPPPPPPPGRNIHIHNKLFYLLRQKMIYEHNKCHSKLSTV